MLHRHCKMCGNTLHTDDTRTEYVSCLGKADCCECFSLASLRSRIAFFSESDSAPCALPVFSSQGSVRKKQRGKDLCTWWQASSRRLNARVPRSRGREHSPVLFTQHDQRPSAMSDMISFGASDGELNDSLFFWWLRTWRSYRALWLAPPSYRHPLHVTPDSERIRSSSASWQRLSMSLGLNGLRWGAISQQAGRVFSHWALSIPPPTLAPPSSPKFIRAHDIVACPPLVSHPSSFRCSSNRSATAGTQTSPGATSQTHYNSSTLEEPAVAVRVIPAARCSPVVDPLEMEPPLSSERYDMASTAPVMGPACVANQREPFGLPERVLNTMAEARAPSTRCLYALKWSVFSTWCQDRNLDRHYRNLGSLRYGRSTAFLAVLWAALLSRFFEEIWDAVGRSTG